ncbi:MAG: glycosyltransferase family 39 protein [Actinobacteria bacterium]|nr:glycosyltransferase family 39 protein [Actinomycetota bacterium]
MLGRRQSRSPQPSWRGFVAMLLLIAIAGFAGRVAYVMTTTRHEHALYDNAYYVTVADSVAAGDGFIDAFGVHRQAAPHPPLTVLLLAAVAKLTGPESMRATGFRITMSAFGALTIVAVGLLACEVAGRRAGLLAAGFTAVTPAFWMNDALVMSETLAALTTALVLLFAYRLLRSGRARDFLGLGVACGLAMLARSELALLVLFVAVPVTLLAGSRTPRRRVVQLGGTLAAAALVISPWVGYNLSRFNQPVLLSTGDGAVLAGANCKTTYHGYWLAMWSFSCSVAAGKGATGDVSEQSNHARKVGLHYIRTHEGRAVTVAALRMARLWGVYRPFQTAHLAEGRPRWAADWGVWWFWASLPVALAGAVAARRRKIPLTPLIGTLFSVTVVAAIFWGSLRFRVPAEVAIALLVALAADALAGGGSASTADTPLAVGVGAGADSYATVAPE